MSADTIDGGGGSDYLNGGGAGDTYLFGVGSGNDTITEYSSDFGTDILRFLGLNASDVEFRRTGNDLYAEIASTGETVRVVGQFNGTNGIEQVAFADGTTWDRSEIQTAAWYRGTAAGENLYGTSADEVFDGKGGNDYLSGGDGGDTYFYAVGYGNDTISEGASDGTTDIAKLVGLNPSDVTFSRINNSNHLVIQINATGETLTVQNQFSGTSGIEQVVFADGTMWDRSQIQSAAWYRGTAAAENIYGSASADTIDGKGGNDNLIGGNGGDTYIYAVGYGNDTISEGASDGTVDAAMLVGLNSSDVTFGRSGNNLLIQIIATGETLTVQNQFSGTSGIEQVVFADDTMWDRSQIVSAAWIEERPVTTHWLEQRTMTFSSAALATTSLTAVPAATLISIGQVTATTTSTTRSGSTTDIDILHLTDLNATDFTFSRVGVNLVATVISNGQTITFDEQFYSQTANWGLEKIEFADGTSWDLATINASGWICGTSGNDTISGTVWNDTFKGGLGDDLFNSGAGSDTYIYSSGDGNDYINDESGLTTDIDVLHLTDLNAADFTFSRVGVNLVATVNSNGQTITFDEQFYSQTANWGLEKIEFADGTSWDLAAINANAWIRGTSGNDTMSGSAWNDMVAGGAGNDVMSGGSGNDTFVFRADLGQDVITDFTTGGDVLEFRDGIFVDAAAALAAATASGNDTLITIDANNGVLLQNVTLANLHTTDFHVV